MANANATVAARRQQQPEINGLNVMWEANVDWLFPLIDMGKFMKPGKVVMVLAGRYAGRKAVIVKVGGASAARSRCLLARCH